MKPFSVRFRRLVLPVVLILAGVPAPIAFAQGLSKVAGVYDSTKYQYAAYIAQGNSSTGSQTVIVCPGYVTLPDGRLISPYTTNAPIEFDATSSNASEIETPSAVSFTAAPVTAPQSNNMPCVSITATFTYTHGASQQVGQVISGDQGIQEAVNDAGNNGGGLVYWLADGGPVTLNTSGTTTTVCSGCVPINALVLGVVARVTTAIAGSCTGWELGDGTTATRFTGNNTTLTAGTVSAADLQTTSGVASTTTGMLNITSAKNIVSTCAGGDPSAGALHVRAFGYILATPNY